MCKACWAVADDQHKEDNKQAFDGQLCAEFTCWERGVDPYSYCRAHRADLDHVLIMEKVLIMETY